MMTTDLNIRQLVLRLLIGAAISFALLAFLLYGFSTTGKEINLSKLVDIIRNVVSISLIWYLLTQLIGVGLRSLRYQQILHACGDKTHPGLADLFPVTLIRNMTVDLLPSRIGELVFVGLLKRTNNTNVSHSLTTLVFATLFDIAIILPVVIILSVVFLTERQSQLTMLAGAGVLLLALVVVYFAMKRLAPWLSERIVGFSENHNSRIMKKLGSFVQQLNQAVQATILSQNLGSVVWLTIGLRISKYAGLCLLFIGVVDVSFPYLADIPISQIISILIAGETAASLPIPTFLSLGSYEAGAAGMLTFFNVDLPTAVLIMLALHLCSQVIDYILGLMGVAWLLFRSFLSSDQRSTLSSPTKIRLSIMSLVAIAGLTAVFFGFQATRNAWSLNAPPAGEPVELGLVGDESLNQLLNDWDSGKGFIVWSSNRGGNHDIYHMTVPQRKVTRLTTHSHTENLPKISPDGRKLIFQRGRKPWHSFRDPTPWDIILKDLETGEEKRLAENASDPNWSTSNDLATFRRNFGEVYSIDIKSGEEKLLFKSSALNLPDNAGLQTPMINSLGELAVTVRGPLRMTAVYKIGNPIHIGQGCQVTWSPDETFVYYIDHGGKGQNLLRKYDFSTGENIIWMDMPNDFSHEYFPKLTKDGRWLVFAASTGGHEHDTADYELFLWQVDSDPATAIRLTHHSGNDSWPDIFIH